MLEILSKYWIECVLALAILGYALYLALTKNWPGLRYLALTLMLKAEMLITGTKKGQERMELVFEQVYNLIPVWLRFFITRSRLKEKLQEWFDLAKDYLDDGDINNSQ